MSGTSIKPIFYSEKETDGFLKLIKDNIEKNFENPDDANYLINFPTVYIHIWRSKEDALKGRYSLYIGESNNVIDRTQEHLDEKDAGKWENHLLNDVDKNGNHVVPEIYIFGHKFFHKSLTLDIENKLIDYCTTINTIHMYNGRGNPQREYEGVEYLDNIFGMIWNKLHEINKDVFVSESKILKSAIYRASPNHKLTDDQLSAKDFIIGRVEDALKNNKKGQLIFVEGEAGTGKTVLTSTTFYELLENKPVDNDDFKCYLLINHDEQFLVYQQMSERLGYSKDVVWNPTSFIIKHSKLSDDGKTYVADENNMADVVFIDEAHLLWTQSKQAFSKKYGSNQLDEIIKRSKITIIMYDGNQVLRKEQFEEYNFMQKYRDLAKSQGINIVEKNYIHLINQHRMNCDTNTMCWIDDVTKKQIIDKLVLNSNHQDKKGYEVKLFDNPRDLENAIKHKASLEDSELSRLIATYDWEYIDKKNAPECQKYWRVKIGDWELPWNEQKYHLDIEPKLKKTYQKRKYSNLDWAEKDYSIDEVGSTFTIQGFDLVYAGLIIGPSVHYNKQTNKIEFLESKRPWDEMKGNRTLKDGSTVNVTNTLSQNELRVLMTRGTKGLYIYACDDNLREKLKECLVIKSEDQK